MVNLPLGGALVEAGMKYVMGARAQVSSRIPTSSDPVEIGSTARWSDAKGVGLQFDGSASA